MTEPREIASSAQEVAPGLWHWRISNSNIGGHTSSSQALMTREGLISSTRCDWTTRRSGPSRGRWRRS